MQMQQYAYPFDPNGTAPSNKVVGERHTISPVNGPDFRFMIPRAAPFFRQSLKVTHVASGRILVDGIDYQPGHRYDAASNTAPFLTIFGSILIMDNTLEGTFDLEYQTLGGEHTINEQLALQLLANAQLDPRLTKWDSVLNAPGVYDPLLHRHSALDTVGYDDMVVALNRLVDAIIEDRLDGTEDVVARSQIQTHRADKNNPHETRLAQLPDGAYLLNLTQNHVTTIVEALDSGSGIGGGGSQPIEPTTNQLKAGDFFVPDNSGGPATYLMPETPANLATVTWLEGEVSFATHKLILQMTDKPIMGLEENFEVTSAGAGGKMVYFDALGYWKVYLDTQAGSATASGSNGVNPVNTPVISSPTNEQAGLTAVFTATCSGFGTTPVLADSLKRYEWQLATDTSFNNLLWSGNTATNSVSPNATIPADTRVYLRVRFVGNAYGAGQWSSLVTFVVGGIAGPATVTISGTQLASGGVTHQFVVQSSAYVGSSTHASSQFQVLNGAGTVVYDSGELAGAIVSHKPFDSNFRPTNLTDYTARVRYKLATGQWTQYTSTTLRTGNGAFTSFNTTVQTSDWVQRTINAHTSWYTAGGSIDYYGAPAPYYICFAGDGNSGPAEWVCSPSDPLSNAPPEFNLQDDGYPSIGGPYPRTSVITQRVTSERSNFNTTRITQSWTEW